MFTLGEGPTLVPPFSFFKEKSVKLSKCKIELVAIGLILVICAGVWIFMSTRDDRIKDAEYKNLERFAKRQAVEIAIIQQAVRLQQLKAAIQKAQMQEPPINDKLPKTMGPPVPKDEQ